MMPVIYQHTIMRADLLRNPTVLYVFGDNEQRKGLGGQAKEMRGEPNAVGIRTKRAPSADKGDFWYDSDDSSGLPLSELRRMMIDEDLEPIEAHLLRGGIVVLPSAGIGTGFARLAITAPKLLAYINHRLERLAVIGLSHANV